MKKLMSVIIAIVLCFCMLSPMTALAADTNAEENYASVVDYVAAAGEEAAPADSMLKVKTIFAKILNALSNFFINDLLGGILNLLIPSSSAVLDYEEFDLDSYEGFYAGMDEFIDEPAANGVWSLGYGKASVLPADFGKKSYAKGAYIPYIFGKIGRASCRERV